MEEERGRISEEEGEVGKRRSSSEEREETERGEGR